MFICLYLVAGGGLRLHSLNWGPRAFLRWKLPWMIWKGRWWSNLSLVTLPFVEINTWPNSFALWVYGLRKRLSSRSIDCCNCISWEFYFIADVLVHKSFELEVLSKRSLAPSSFFTPVSFAFATFSSFCTRPPCSDTSPLKKSTLTCLSSWCHLQNIYIKKQSGGGIVHPQCMNYHCKVSI